MAALHLDKEQFENLMSQEKPVLVDFWAPWCSYCRRIEQAYEKIAEQYSPDIAVAKLNIDEQPLIAQQAGIEVIPTLLLYKDGQAIASVVAPESKAAIDAFIAKNIGK